MNDKDIFGFFNGFGSKESSSLKDRMKTMILRARAKFGNNGTIPDKNEFCKMLANDYIKIYYSIIEDSKKWKINKKNYLRTTGN